MAKRSGNSSATVIDEETPTMFPELDDANPKHKELIKAAKRFAKSKQERDELLSTAKEKVDSDGTRLIALMHMLDFSKFRHNGVRVEIIPSKEKCQVKIDTDDSDGSDSGEDD